jgi:hypothetical protein
MCLLIFENILNKNDKYLQNYFHLEMLQLFLHLYTHNYNQL